MNCPNCSSALVAHILSFVCFFDRLLERIFHLTFHSLKNLGTLGNWAEFQAAYLMDVPASVDNIRKLKTHRNQEKDTFLYCVFKSSGHELYG